MREFTTDPIQTLSKSTTHQNGCRQANRRQKWLWLPFFTILFAMCSCAEQQPTQTPNRFALITADKMIPARDDHPPILHHDGWYQPEPINNQINSAGLEDSAFITPDGTMLFFFFTPNADISAAEQVNDGVTGICLSENHAGKWEAPTLVQLSKSNQPVLDGCPFYDGKTLWFCSIREGNFRPIDFWTAERENGKKWVNIRNAGKQLNKDFQIGEMHGSLDGTTLFFHRVTVNQGMDLWQTYLQSDQWAEPTEIQMLNSSADDSRPALSPDESELWFTRTFKGTPAIFRSIRQESGWSAPELIISQFAGEPSIDAIGNIYFTHHFYKDGSMLEADIYIARKK